MMNQMIGREDLSESYTRKLIRYESIIANIIEEAAPIRKEMTPKLCMKILKYACEVRNKALQGTNVKTGKYRVGESYYIRDALSDIKWFMRTIKRQLGGEFPDEYKCCQLYFEQQKNYFRQLERVSNETSKKRELSGGTRKRELAAGLRYQSSYYRVKRIRKSAYLI